MSNQPTETSTIQKPGHVTSGGDAEIQKPGHIFRAYAAAVQAQSHAAQCHEEIVLALQEQAGISRPGYDASDSGILRPGHVASQPPQEEISRPLGHPSLQEALQDVAAASQALARASNTLRLLISRPGF